MVPSHVSNPLIGQTIGHYKISEPIGSGGMGVVYRAQDLKLGRMVALKVISEEHTKDEDFVELFVHEARAAAKLNHPNVVQVYDVKRHGEIYYFSMEYVSGGSVQDVLNKQRKVGVDRGDVRLLADCGGAEFLDLFRLRVEGVERGVRPLAALRDAVDPRRDASHGEDDQAEQDPESDQELAANRASRPAMPSTRSLRHEVG